VFAGTPTDTVAEPLEQGTSTGIPAMAGDDRNSQIAASPTVADNTIVPPEPANIAGLTLNDTTEAGVFAKAAPLLPPVAESDRPPNSAATITPRTTTRTRRLPALSRAALTPNPVSLDARL
jgi:hypothetical protein